MDPGLERLAAAAGLMPRWHDVFGREHLISAETAHAVLRALGLPAGSAAQLAASLDAAAQPAAALPKLLTADAGVPVRVPAPAADYEVTLEDGRWLDGHATAARDGCSIPAIMEAGYHRLRLGAQETTLAVAPRACFTIRDAHPGGLAFGLAVQLYALRRDGDAGIGDFTALAEFAASAARHGAHCIAISPAHAQFTADPKRFGPYAPSSRVALNVMHSAVDVEPPPDTQWQRAALRLEARDLVDWPAAAELRVARLRSIFAHARADPGWMEEFHAFRSARGEALELHARFEALHAHIHAQGGGPWNWRDWPPAYRDPARPEVAAFAREYRRQVDFHAFMQFLADDGLAHAQATARRAGMSIGLIADLAVGVDPGGSTGWSRQSEMLGGLTIGAPPDLYNTSGQNWGLAAFSPRGLVRHGFGAFLEMLRASLAHAGGVRIDHGMGLNRLWVVPEGASAAEGAYLAFPEQDLLRLLALESQRHRSIVLAEDLGTLPAGFQHRLAERGVAGMRVMYFERDEAQHFTAPMQWTAAAAAMTTTHDLPTVAGWWSGTDIERRTAAGFVPDLAQETALRAADRTLLWAAFVESGAATGPEAAAQAPEAAVDAACLHVGGSRCDLAIVPVEDVLAIREQPNLPNTLDQHPNWRRRLPGNAATMLDGADPARRLSALRTSRLEGAKNWGGAVPPVFSCYGTQHETTLRHGPPAIPQGFPDCRGG